jgi:hypothetical protein
VTLNIPPEENPVKSVCSAVTSTTFAGTDPTTTNQSCETSTACSVKLTAKSHQEFSQQKAPNPSTWTISTQTPLMVHPREPFLTTSQAFLPSELQPEVKPKVDDQSWPGQSSYSSCPAIPQPLPKHSKESWTTLLENGILSIGLQTTTQLYTVETNLESDKHLENLYGTSVESKVHSLVKDFRSCSTNKPPSTQPIIPGDKRSSMMLASNSVEPAEPGLEPRLPSSTPISNVLPSNPPARNQSLKLSSTTPSNVLPSNTSAGNQNPEDSSRCSLVQDIPGGGSKIVRRVFTHNGVEVTFWPSTGIFREVHTRPGTTKWMIPKPYAVWVETPEDITVYTDEGRFSWDPRTIADPDKDFPYWKELKHIIDTISIMTITEFE